MDYFKQMIGVLERIKSHNYFSIFYDEAYKELVDIGYIEVDERNLIVVSDIFIKKYYSRLSEMGYSKYQIQVFTKSPIHPVYFKNELLAQYLNNPNYHFRWNHYRGYIVSVDKGVDNVYFKNICLAHDLINKEPVTLMFLGDVLKFDIEYQNYLKRFEIINHDYLEPNQEVVNNLIYGKRSKYEDSDIYNIIIQGMKICNKIFSCKYEDVLFMEVMNVEDYEHFHPIFISSKINYYLFVLELYKMIYDNIKIKALKKVVFDKKPELKEEMKNQEKWPLWRIMEFALGRNITKYLKNLSEIRNIPAHEIYNNDIKSEYWHRQDELLLETYRFLNTIIVNFASGHFPQEMNNYTEVFGPEGKISYSNGFNQSPYRFYNGQIRLICERFQERDAEYLVAFKSIENYLDRFISYVINKRPDLDKESVRHVVHRIFSEETHKPDTKMVESFFKGYYYIDRFHNPNKYYEDEYIELGRKKTYSFLKIYNIDNIFVFGDSTDPYFSEFRECFEEKNLTGRGYITELIHFFKEEYQFDNVVTDPEKDLDIQVLSNVWD